MTVSLGKTGWPVSPVGFGSYRIQEGVPEHAEALRLSLLSGCNLIDTSTNYGDGSSELLIGRVLRELQNEGRLKREDVFVVSKAGYVQGSNLELALKRKRQGKAFPEMVELSPECWHCISPEFLEEQLTASLKRLGLEQLDALLLHNPEYFLKSGGEHAEYYRRIEVAFRHLEKEIKKGRIRWYGISSNTFPEPREAADYTSLEAIADIAEKISPDHRFALIQFPFNLYEPGAALEPNNGGLSLIEYAHSKNLGTLVNRPLNAFSNQGLVRLADFASHSDRDIVGDFKESMNEATALEASYPGKKHVPARQIAWGHVLRENFPKLSDIDAWKSFLTYRIEPSLKDAWEILGAHPEYKNWIDAYRQASSHLFDAFTAYLESQASVKSDKLADMLDHLCPELQGSRTLSQKAIRLIRSIPGVHCVLVGMRQTPYVRDALELQPCVSAQAALHALAEFSRQSSPL